MPKNIYTANSTSQWLSLKKDKSAITNRLYNEIENINNTILIIFFNLFIADIFKYDDE